ncbi:MAG: hypothetical protein AABX93_00465 [Nanoarchaeota archaeon]
MKTNKKILTGTLFLFAIILLANFSNALTISSPQFTAPGANSFSYLGRQGVNPYPIFNSNQCQNGQDFIIQVAPFGCTPAVVRSDLLEEQNVPVFCQLYATKINPLIKVEAIDSISFSGNYPPAVSGVGFHPANAAIRSTQSTLLNSPILQNIGYAVIVLKQNSNESSMPEIVSGNLTANVRYDIQNAFGIGPSTQYLPELNGQQWDEKFAQYSFWSGKGFLKADGITNDGAVISIYADKENKISTFTLKKGETSGDVYLPGFYCQAGLQLRLDDVTSPTTRAKLNIHGEITEVVEGEQFLENQCSARYVNKKGIAEEVAVECRTDTGFERFSLKINPTLVLEIDGEKKTVNLGDKLYTTADGKKTVYLAYIGTNGDSVNPDDLFVYLLEMPENKNNLTREDLESAKSLISNLIHRRITGGSLVNVPANILTGYAGLANRIAQYLGSGKDFGRLDFKKGESIVEETMFGKKVKIAGFSEPTNVILNNANERNYYENAMKDYNEIINKFSNEKSEQSTFGKDALVGAIDLAIGKDQKKTATDLCLKFKEKYPKDYVGVEDKCSAHQTSSKEIGGKGVVINGRTKIISLMDISEPTQDEFSAEILVKKSDGTQGIYTLTKNEVLNLGENPQNIYSFNTFSDYSNTAEFQITGSVNPNYPSQIYLGFSNGKWMWSESSIGVTWHELNDLKLTQPTSNKNPAIMLTGKSKQLLNDLQKISTDYNKGSVLLVDNYNAVSSPYTRETDFIQLDELSENSARVKINIRGTTNLISDKLTLNRNVQSTSGNYIFTLTNVNLKKVAKVSVIPNIRNAGTSANFSFSVGIEKRGIQLSPDQIRKRIDALNKTIAEWEKNSEQLGKVVKGFNAACLTVGTTLTIKNLFDNFDGKAIARQEVMRSSGGWMDLCKDKVNRGEFSTIDACLLKNSDQIEKDVTLVEGKIKNQQAITKDNVEARLSQVRGKLETKFEDPNDKTGKTFITTDANIEAAFTKDGFEKGKISLSQARDIERLETIYNDPNAGTELKRVAQGKLYKIMSDIQANSKNFETYTSLQNELKTAGFDLPVDSYAGKNAIQGNYNGGVLLGTQISGVDGIDKTKSYPTKIVTYNNEKYVLLLDGDGTNYFIKNAYKYGGVSENGIVVNVATAQEESLIKNSFSKFVKYDRTTYENKFLNPEVRYFETEPYKGLPAIVPFDTGKGWYVATKQTVSGLGNIKAYDESGRLNSFYICNVGKDGREAFGTEGDECRSFNPGNGQISGEFKGLTQPETNTLVSRATRAVEDASRQRQSNSGLTRATILGETMKVGSPATGTPDVQCQDFMSPEDCLLLFNACDPVVCPSSRCNLGGAYTVPNVVQSGIIGSAALCLPNAREGIYVPVCLSGIKAGMDSFISVEKNYRDCLQTNLETGQTVGICDEIHSIYLCDFFWSQAQPLAGIIVPKIFEAITGQTGRGGGEYLGVASAWANADKSVQYMTNYYGASSFEAFRTGIIKEVGHSICKSFVSASYPSKMDFFDSITEPESPPQYTAWFSESTYTTATVPPTSRYKIFYHIFAGKNAGEAGRNSGAFFSVYLKTPQGGSFFQYAPTVTVASGFISPGDYASETKDFTAPSGYKELCVSVNGREECGFKQVTTDFGLDYVQDLYKQDVAGKTDISSEKDCVSGTPSLYSFVNPNLQAGAQEFIDPSLSNSQIVRICATDNPGKGTDHLAGTAGGKWMQVGTCDGGKGTLKCYLDSSSVKTAIQSKTIENATLKSVTDGFIEGLKKEGQYISDFDGELKKIGKFDNKGKIGYITNDLIGRALLSGEKAKLFFIRAKAYGELALGFKGTGTFDLSKIEAKLKIYENDGWKFDKNGVTLVEGGDYVITGTNGNQKQVFTFDGNGNLKNVIVISGDSAVSTGSTSPNLAVLYDEAIAEIKKIDGRNIAGDFATAPSNTPELKKVVDDLYLNGLLTTADYDNIVGRGFWDLEENANSIIKILERKKGTANLSAGIYQYSGLSCTDATECQKKIGNEIIKIVNEMKPAIESSLGYKIDGTVKAEGIAENFQCLVLQVALQETRLTHCFRPYDSNNPLYCNGNSEKIVKGDNGNSWGVMQINTLVHKNVKPENFDESVKYSAQLLVDNYRDYGRELRVFTPTGVGYNGWKASLRGYNGWGTGGNNKYVEEVTFRSQEASRLFSECNIVPLP